MQVSKIPIGQLNPAAYNPRKDLQPGDPEYEKLKRSMQEFGYVEPIVWNKRTGNIVGGHQRYKVLLDIGISEVDCVVVDMDETKEKALNLALNKIQGDWDYEKLKDLLQELDTGEFDLELTGFDMDEIEELIAQIHVPEEIIEDEAPEPPEEAITKPGDLWILGRHRLLCGDATKDYNILIDNKDIKLLFTDPPYGVSVVGSNGSIGKGCLAKEGTYRPVIGDDTYFNPTYLLNIGEKQIIWGANYFHDKLPLGTRWLVWDKERPDGTTFSDCELAWTSIEGVAVKKYKCTWHGMIREGESEKRVHPTQKPLKLCCEIIKDYTDENDIVLDLFGGSGTTLIAAEQLNRTCYMMELDPIYCDVIVQRYINLKGHDGDVYLERDGNKIAFPNVT